MSHSGYPRYSVSREWEDVMHHPDVRVQVVHEGVRYTYRWLVGNVCWVDEREIAARPPRTPQLTPVSREVAEHTICEMQAAWDRAHTVERPFEIGIPDPVADAARRAQAAKPRPDTRRMTDEERRAFNDDETRRNHEEHLRIFGEPDTSRFNQAKWRDPIQWQGEGFWYNLDHDWPVAVKTTTDHADTPRIGRGTTVGLRAVTDDGPFAQVITLNDQAWAIRRADGVPWADTLGAKECGVPELWVPVTAWSLTGPTPAGQPIPAADAQTSTWQVRTTRLEELDSAQQAGLTRPRG